MFYNGTQELSKRVLVILFVLISFEVSSLYGGSFERNCIPCHRKEGVSLRKAFMNALLIYSGERNMKAGLKYFLRHPSKETSVMGEEYFTRHRLKQATKLLDRELDEALDEYWERYRVIGRLR